MEISFHSLKFSKNTVLTYKNLYLYMVFLITLIIRVVGVHGFEPWTTSLSGTRSNQLSYTPKSRFYPDHPERNHIKKLLKNFRLSSKTCFCFSYIIEFNFVTC